MIIHEITEVKKTGVDKLSKLNLTQKFRLVAKIILNDKASCIKRVLIAKANKKLRPYL